ncbi:hypothetical protein GE061_009355 [Apolygus lucorum]|uniref:Uncharacterized protein n=1 Tax=Apolygus lucorum TaxID=248454 RepID=A0A6A4JST8_APOLU|nr:hypothetical protein GE061_009355 [Apolygus lucorum]
MRRHVPGYAVRGRFVQARDVIFQELLPMRLKSRVSAKGDRTNNAHCVQEMSVFFACLKKNEFVEKHCGPELAAFQKCITTHEAAQKLKSDVARRGELIPGEKSLSHHQISSLLKKYPG